MQRFRSLELRCADANNDFRRISTCNIHRSNGAAVGAGVNAMRLNRKTEPLVYKRVAFRTTLLDEQKRSDQQLDIAIGILGAVLLVIIFVVAG